MATHILHEVRVSTSLHVVLPNVLTQHLMLVWVEFLTIKISVIFCLLVFLCLQLYSYYETTLGINFLWDWCTFGLTAKIFILLVRVGDHHQPSLDTDQSDFITWSFLLSAREGSATPQWIGEKLEKERTQLMKEKGKEEKRLINELIDRWIPIEKEKERKESWK